MATTPYLSCQNLTMRFGSTVLFENLSLVVHPGDRWGIIGANGSGKTTLFRILDGEIQPQNGQVALRTGTKVSIITQEFSAKESGTVSEYLRAQIPTDIDKQREILEHKITVHAGKVETTPHLAECADWLDELCRMQEDLDNLSGVSPANIVESALRVARLSPLADRPHQALSGGERKRLQIVGALLKNPQLILLDEPTNHLDMETVEWLEEFLLGVAEHGAGLVGIKDERSNPEPCAFIIISHDRSLLDTLVNRIVEIDRGRVEFYNGNFEAYTEEHLRRAIAANSARDKMANLFRRELAWLRAGTKARTTKQTARIERAHALSGQLSDQNARVQAAGASELEFGAALKDMERDETDSLVPRSRPLGEQELVALKKLTLAHPAQDGRQICRDLNLVLKPRMRVALLGFNGCGKSTILRNLAEHLPVMAGEVKWHDLSEILYFDQHRNELNGEDSIRDVLCPKGDFVHFGGKPLHFMAYLDKFLFSKYDAPRPIKELSGGERARVLLAKLMLSSGNVLLLDEPTNDLDIPTLQMLENSLQAFQGGVIFTSHDRYFIQRIATHVLTYAGEAEPGVGQWIMCADLQQAIELIEKGSQSKDEQRSKTSGSATVKKKGLNFQEKKELENVEELVHSLENQLKAEESILANLYAAGEKFSKTDPVAKKIVEIKKNLSIHSARWEELFART